MGKVNRILFKEGQVVKVGEVIIEIDDGSKTEEKKPEPASVVKNEPQESISVSEADKEKEYCSSERYKRLEVIGYKHGFRFVASGPLVRTSYRAFEAWAAQNIKLN